MTEQTTTTTEWGVEYRWPDGHVQTEWHGADRLSAEADMRHVALSESRTETAALVTRTITTVVTTSPTTRVGRRLAFDIPALPVPVFNLAPLDDDDPTVVVPADQFQQAPQ